MSSIFNDKIVPVQPHPIFIDVEYLTSKILPFASGSIYNLRTQKRLPFPSYKICGKVCFKYIEVINWVNTLTDSTEVQFKRRGAPTKAERIAKRESENKLSNSQSA